MPLQLEGIVERFSSNLYGLYQAAHNELIQQQLKPLPRWMKSYLIFSALEKFRSRIAMGLEAPSPYCRFSLGRRKNDQHAKLDQVISQLRTLRTGVGGRPLQLSEYLVDFTFSVGTLKQSRGDEDFEGDAKFKLLLAAESELASDFSLALEDCLKVLDVVAPVKVIVFRSSASVNAQVTRRTRLAKLFNLHGPLQHQQSIQWLFLGIPTFGDWRKEEADVVQLSKQVYTLTWANNSYSLVDQGGWTDAAVITYD